MVKISNAAWALLLGLEAQPYFEYVRSKADIADLPSRRQNEETIAILTKLGWRRDQVTVLDRYRVYT